MSRLSFFALVAVLFLNHFPLPTAAIDSVGVENAVLSSVFSEHDVLYSSVRSNELEQGHDSRELAAGLFHDLEVVYQYATIDALPNQTLTGAIQGNNWTVDIKFLQCQNLTIGDLELNYVSDQVQFLEMNLSSTKFDFNCFMDYQYRYLTFNGSGRAEGSTTSASALLVSAFISNNFTSDGPSGFGVQSCNASTDFSSLNFRGRGVGSVPALQNAAETQLLGALKLESEIFVCEALNTLNFTIIELLLNVSNFLGAGGNSSTVNDTLTQEIMLAEAGLSANTTNTTLLSFSKPQGTLASVITFLIQEVTSYFASYSNATDLNINDVMRSYVLGNDGSLSLNASFLFNVFDGAFFSGGGYFSQSYLLPETMQVFGLDRFTSFSPFQAVGDYTWQTNFSIDSLSLLVSMVWLLPDGTGETVTLEIEMDQVNATVDLLIAIDQDLLEAIHMGSVLNSSNLLNCIFSTVYDTRISNLNFEVGEIKLPKVGGFEYSPGSKIIATKFMSAFYDMFHFVVLGSLPGFFQTTGRDLLTNLTGQLIGQTSCPPPSLSVSPAGLIDVRDLFLSPDKAKVLGGSGTSPYGDVANAIKGIIDSLLVGNSTGVPGINDILIGPLTLQQSGIAGSLTDLFNLDQKLNAEDSISARIRLKVSDVNIDNIAIGEPFFLLDPIATDPYLLSNTATLGVNDSTPLQLRADIFFHWDGDDGLQINDNVTVGVDIFKANILASIVLELVEERLINFPLKDAFNLQCWLATMSTPTLDARGVRTPGTDQTFGLREFNISADMVKFDMTCLNCTKRAGFQALQDILKSDKGSKDAFHAVNKLVQFLARAVNSGVLQLYLDRMIVGAPHKCPHSQTPRRLQGHYEPLKKSGHKDSIGFLVALLAATVGLIVAAVVVSALVRFGVRRRYRKWLQTLPPNQLLLVYKKQCSERIKVGKMNEVARSMFQSEEIPACVRTIIPIIVLLNVGLFLSGHLNVAGSVEIRAQVAGQELRVEDFYKFSVILSARDLWNSGGRLPAVLIFVFSVIWPYTKQFVTFALWFLPPSKVPLSVRGFVFQLLDILAKWSVIDIFFFIMSLVAFRLSITSATVSYLPPNFYSAELFLQPLWGLYANLIAQLISQVSAHFILSYHRRTVNVAKREADRLEQEESDGTDELKSTPQAAEPTLTTTSQGEGNSEQLCKFGFNNSNQVELNKLKVRGWVPLMIFLLAVAVCAAVIAGCILPSFSFTTQGIVNIVLEAGHGFKEIVNHRSIFSMARLLIQQAEFLATTKARVGLGSLAVLLVLNTLVVPIIHVILVVAQFILPLSPRAHANLEVAVEISQDWQYLDVYVVSILISLSQLGTFSESLVNPFCRSINGFLSALSYYHVIDHRDDQCYRVQAHINSGGYLLLAAAFMMAVLHSFVTKALVQYRRNKMEAAAANSQAAINNNIASDVDDVNRVKKLIQAPPVMFTDTFRWFLYPEMAAPPSTATERGETITVEKEKVIDDDTMEEGVADSGKPMMDDDDDDEDDPALVDREAEQGPLFEHNVEDSGADEGQRNVEDATADEGPVLETNAPDDDGADEVPPVAKN